MLFISNEETKFAQNNGDCNKMYTPHFTKSGSKSEDTRVDFVLWPTNAQLFHKL